MKVRRKWKRWVDDKMGGVKLIREMDRDRIKKR